MYKEPSWLGVVRRRGWWSVGKRKQGEEGVRPEDGQGDRQTDRRQTPTVLRYSAGRLWLSREIWVAGNEAARKAQEDYNNISLTKIWTNKVLFALSCKTKIPGLSSVLIFNSKRLTLKCDLSISTIVLMHALRPKIIDTILQTILQDFVAPFNSYIQRQIGK